MMLSSRAMKVYLETLGCKLNESELEAWARKFGADGYEIVADARNADLCVLNTCAITHVAARKSRQAARQMARANPNARVVLTGCYATVEREKARALPNVAFVVPNADKEGLVAILKDEGGRMRDEVSHPSPLIPHPSLRTRAFVKIQDGCNMSCTYCIIPLARGKECSRSLREVVEEVRGLAEAGYQEIVLTGVQISVYRDVAGAGASPARTRDGVGAGLAPAHTLRDLVAAILAETTVPRLRLTSIAPWDFDASLLELWRDARLCRHLHFSLQSGSDAVLRRMRRPYTAAQFARAVEMAREHSPDVGITTDVIVGFPGESDAEFEESLRFVESVGFARVHVFPYSTREGTSAAAMSQQTLERVKQSRVKAMQAVADASARGFAARFIGRTMQVLWETRAKDEGRGMKDEVFHPSAFRLHPSVWSGYSDNYIRVTAPSDAPLRNQITPVMITDISHDGVVGNVTDIRHPDNHLKRA